MHKSSLRPAILCFGCAVILLLMANGCGRGNKAMITSVLEEAKQKFAPDRRTVVFDVRGMVTGNALQLDGEIQSAELKDRLCAFVQQRLGMTVIDSLTVLPESSLGEKTWGVVCVSVANVRTHPDQAAEMGTQALLGTPVRILKQHRGWYYVQTPDEYLGWTDDPIALMSPGEYARWSAMPKIIVTAAYGWVRESPLAASLPVGDVVAGCLLAAQGKSRGCWEVGYADGRTGVLPLAEGVPLDGWLAAAKDSPENIVATAKRFTGVPYLWGGTSAKGMDCSGFTKTVYYLNGVLLPRDASQQVLVGNPIELPTDNWSLEAGDLLFFGSRGASGAAAKVTHVAISLGGKRFIHSSGRVRINSLDPADADYSEHRSRSFLSARRIIGAGESSGVRRLVHIPYYHGNEP